MKGRYTYHFDPITSAFIEYRYYERDFEKDSNISDESYTDNRFFFRVTTQYDTAELFQR